MSLVKKELFRVTEGPHNEGGDRLKEMIGQIDFDDSYPTGGEALDLSDFFSTLHMVTFENKSGLIFEYDYTNKKVKAFYPTKAQAAVTTDKLTIAASGSGNITDGQSVTVDATFRSAVDVGAGDEVPNTTDLSAITGVRFRAVGV